MKPLTREWIRKAEGDRRTAEGVAELRPPEYDTLCFHWQQLGEKYLKAYLQEYDVRFPRTHDLVELLNLLKSSGLGIPGLRRSADVLTQYAVIYRYPGFSANRQRAVSARRAAEKIRSAVRQRLSFSD